MENIQRVRSVFTVKEKIFIAPNYIRIIFHMNDAQTEQFRNVTIGRHNKIFIPTDGISREDLIAEDIWNTDAFTAVRTYTTRGIDYENRTICVDFIAHGYNGPASKWALQAEEGSLLGIAMKTGKKPLIPDAKEYLFIGDSTAIPVISVILEQLNEKIKVKAILEVHEAGHEMKFETSAQLEVEWLFNSHPEKGSRLSEYAIKQLTRANKRYVFIAAEYTTVKNMKNYLQKELGWSSREFSAVSYWKLGDSEENSVMQRRAEMIGQ